MMKKTEETYYHVYAPFNNEEIKDMVNKYYIEKNTFLFTPHIKFMMSGKQNTVRFHTNTRDNPTVRILSSFVVGPRAFNNTTEIEYVLNVMKGVKKRAVTEDVPMIVPRGYNNAKKSYPIKDIVETTNQHYIMKNGRALKKSNYTETKVQVDHPELLLKPDGTTQKRSKWQPATLKKEERAKVISILEWGLDIMTNVNKLEVEAKEKELELTL